MAEGGGAEQRYGVEGGRAGVVLVELGGGGAGLPAPGTRGRRGEASEEDREQGHGDA